MILDEISITFFDLLKMYFSLFAAVMSGVVTSAKCNISYHT